MMGSFKCCKKFYTSVLASFYAAMVCLVSVSSYGADLAVCKVAPKQDILGSLGEFFGDFFEGRGETAHDLVLKNEYGENDELGSGDTIWDWAFLFGIAALANYRTLGNLFFMLTYNSALNDSSDLAQDVIRGKVSQKKLEKRQKKLAKSENLYFPIWNSREVNGIADALIHKGLPWITGFSIPRPPLETYYNVQSSDQYIGIKKKPAESEKENGK